MRHILCYENALSIGDQFWVDGAIKWTEERVPVVWNFDGSDVRNLLGWATDIQRDDEGCITAEIKFHGPGLALEESGDLKICSASFMADEVEYAFRDKVTEVSSGRLRQIAMVPSDAVLW